MTTEQSIARPVSRPTFALDGRTFVYYKSNGWRLRFLTNRGVQWLNMGTHVQADVALAMQSKDVVERITESIGDAITRAGLEQMMDRQITWGDAIAEWKNHLERVEGLQMASVRTYTTHCRVFATKYSLLNRPVNAVTADHVIECVNGEKTGHRLSTRTIILVSLRKFLEWCAAKGYAMGNAARVIRKVNTRGLKISEKEPRYKEPWTDDEIKRVVAYYDRKMLKVEKRIKWITPGDGNTIGDTQIAYWLDRWRIYFAYKCAVYLARYAGLRIGDCMTFEWDSILASQWNEWGRKLLVYTHKRDRRLLIPMPPEVAALLPQMMAQRNDERYVFKEMARRYYEPPDGRAKISSSFCTVLKQLGLKRRCFHGLRVTYAYACRDAGMTTDHIAALLTHLDAETTALYLGGPGPKRPWHQPGYAAVAPAAAPAAQTSHQNEPG